MCTEANPAPQDAVDTCTCNDKSWEVLSDRQSHASECFWSLHISLEKAVYLFLVLLLLNLYKDLVRRSFGVSKETKIKHALCVAVEKLSIYFGYAIDCLI